MRKINFQLETDKYIKSCLAAGRRERLLLHACCAPCSSYVLEYLSEYFDITVLFSNPNITDGLEYRKRLTELYRLCESASFARGIEVVDDKVCASEFFSVVRGLENEPEGGKRCTECFKLRLQRTAEYAAKNGFDLFATTLTVSPHKNAELINEIGLELAEKNEIKYLLSDFKKREGYKRSILLSKEYGLYRQNYCGCCFSMDKSSLIN